MLTLEVDRTGESRPAVFLDRDGVINEDRPDYVKSWTEFVFLPNVFHALSLLAERYAIVVVTNQSAIGRGIARRGTIDYIHLRMKEQVARQGGRIDGVFYCPHIPGDRCACRKPRPGLLLEAAHALNLDLRRSWLVGDAASDVEAAVSAGASPLLVRTGRGEEQRALLANSTVPVLKDLWDAANWVLSARRQAMSVGSSPAGSSAAISRQTTR